MSGNCDFCGVWHSGPCCHPGKMRLKERDAEIARLRKIESAALLACGVLWMIEHRRGKVATAFHALRDALGQQGLGEAIQRAIDEGHEADHPPSADWWAGKKDSNDA